MRLIIFALCLSSLVKAQWTTFSWCDTDGDFTDPFTYTKQFGKMLEGLIVALIVAEAVSPEDQSFPCAKITFGDQGGLKAIILDGKTAEGDYVTYAGNITFQNNNNYMELKPLDEAYLAIFGAEQFPEGVLSVNSNGETRLYFQYVSETEIVLRTCQNRFFGSRHGVYVLSAQPEGLAELDPECMAEAVNNLPHNENFEVVVKSAEEIQLCF